MIRVYLCALILVALAPQAALATFCSPTSASQPGISDVYTYTFPKAGTSQYWVDASYDPTLWQKAFVSGDPILRFEGSGCYVYSGGIDGPIPLSGVYECSSSCDGLPGDIGVSGVRAGSRARGT